MNLFYILLAFFGSSITVFSATKTGRSDDLGPADTAQSKGRAAGKDDSFSDPDDTKPATKVVKIVDDVDDEDKDAKTAKSDTDAESTQPDDDRVDPDADVPAGDPTNVEPPSQPDDADVSGSGGETKPVRVSEDAIDVVSGRVTTLDLGEDDIASVKIISGPLHGNATVNPDNTIALVLTGSDYAGALDFTYEITRTDGSTEQVQTNLDVAEARVEGGWGLGDFYTLETDDNGESIVEWGDNHREVYVSGSDDALSTADIAAIEGLSVDAITDRWLLAHPEYGGSSEMALDASAANKLWDLMMHETETDPASHWLLLEAGYEYNMSKLFTSGMTGESELHPLHITSYGVGAKPVLGEISLSGLGAKNVVVKDVELGAGGSFNPSENILLEDIISASGELVITRSESFTIRNSEIYDVAREDPTDGETWTDHKDRISGLYTERTEGLLIENTLWDHNGWEADYDLENLSADSDQPPSIYSHNVYIQVDTYDLTFRDNIVMRGASFGAQFRSGGYIEDNVFIDNNAQAYAHGGYKDGEYLGNYTLYADNVFTSAAHREYVGNLGQITGGVGDYAPLSTWVDNVVTHLADPNNPDEQAAKTAEFGAILGGGSAYYNDTIVYNWSAANQDKDVNDLNVDGLDTNVLDQTTIQNFASQLLGDDNATIDDLANYLRAAGEGAFDGTPDSELILNFFQTGFGLVPDGRLEGATLRFIPNDLGDGVRWDNRLNWSTEDLPGTIDGDSVDLGGNWVIYSGTTDIKDLDLGDGGILTINQGHLEVEGAILADGHKSEIDIDDAGQLWINGHDGSNRIDINVDGGRFANTGDLDGKIDLNVTDGQAILATGGASYDLNSHSTLTIVGDDAKVGFESTSGDTAVMRIESDGTLQFKATESGLGTISEFRSGVHGSETIDVASGVNLGEGTLKIDLSDLGDAAEDFSLISVDEMVGAFSSIEVTGMSDNRDASLVFDYRNDEVVLQMGAEGSGSGEFSVSTVGDQNDANDASDLWDALTADQPVLTDQLPDELTIDGEEFLLIA